MPFQTIIPGPQTIKTTAQVRKLLPGGTSYLGTLGELSHEQFVEIVERNGGQYVSYSSVAKISLLVIGDAALPVTSSGEAINMPCRNLIGERKFLELLGETYDEPLYSVRSLAELLKVPQARIRAWVKAGLIKPAESTRGVMRFDFRQVAIARTLFDLTSSGVNIARLRRTLETMQKCLPDLREPLQQLSMLEANGPLLVRLEEGDLSEIDGQLRMTFDDAPAPAPVQMRLMPGPRTAADWHEQGVEQEKAGLLDEAEQSYRQALLVGGADAQTCFDLAALLASRGRKAQAVERYRQTIELDPSRFDAWNNLGILLAELNDSELAIEAFREALRINPHDELAHYNLADTLDAMGNPEAAKPHWRKFLSAHSGEDAHVAHARSRLKSS